MPANTSERIAEASAPRRGFTLIELIVVITLMAVISATAIASMSNLANSRQRATARQLARDLNYARERAIATGVRSWVSFNTGAGSYRIRAENTASPGLASALNITDPATGGAFVVMLNSAASSGVTLTSVSVPGGGSDIGFDWMGRPQDSSGVQLTSNATITLTGGGTVTVASNVGIATVP